MTPSENCFDIIKAHEGLELKAYNDPASGGLPITIGYGNTMRKDGTRFKLGDTLTEFEADDLLAWTAGNIATVVSALLIKVPVNQNQFDAVVSFTYNVGVGNFTSSTLLKKIRFDHNDPAIYNEFLRWDKADGKVLNGLVARRKAEAELYFKS